MKIVLVTPAYPLRGGMAHFGALLYRHLSRRHAVSVVSFSRQYPSFLFPGSTQKEAGESDAPKVPAVHTIDSINPFTWRSTARRIAAQSPDLLLFNFWLPFFGPCFGYIARAVRRLTRGRTRAMFVCHNIVPHERRFFDRLFTTYAFASLDACIVQSRAVERDLRHMFPSMPYRMVPHPIYDIFGQGMSKGVAKKKIGVRDENVMLFFGFIRKYKGLDVLLRAMPDVLKDIRVKLLVVGEFYGDEARYRAMIREQKLEQRVDVRSAYIPLEEVASYFSACDVVVLPYRSATQSGIVQIAYNFNRPVIATDVGGLSEVVVEGVTGRIVQPDDSAALADAIVQFYRKKQEGEFVRGVHAEKKKYSWTNMVTAIEELSRPAKNEESGKAGRQGRGRRRSRNRGWDHSRRRRRSSGPHGNQERGH